MSKQAEAGQAGELLDAGNGVVTSHRLTEAANFLGCHLAVEPKRRRQADRVESAVRKAVTPAQSLRHRVAEAQAGAGEGGARMHRAFQ